MSPGEICLSERERRRAKHALRDGEAIADAAIWVKERVASLGVMLLNRASSTKREL
jgi:hypothetical protein